MNHVGTYTQDEKASVPDKVVAELQSRISGQDALFWTQTRNYIRDMMRKYDAQSNQDLISVEYCQTCYSPSLQIFIHM